MKKEYFYVYLGCLGVLLFLGFLTSLVFLNNHNYYQNQYYNNLPSMQSYETLKPEPIQHYEEMRDESVKATEEINVVESLPSNDTIFSSFNDNRMIIFNDDGSYDFTSMAIFIGFIIANYCIIRNILF